jgi:hypothetical protein
MGQDVLWVLIVALGLRLALQGLRLKTAETSLGMALVLLGLGAAILRRALDDTDPRLATVGLGVLTAGTAMVAWFTQRTFHPANRWANGATAACVLVLGAGLYHQLYACGLGTGAVRQSAALSFSRAAVLAWPAVEALRFRRIYNKRVSLGLADPVVANRFLVFSIWTLALALMPLWVWASTTLSGVAVRDLRSGMLLPVRVLGVVCLVGVVLTFLPPRAYLAFIARRHPAAGLAT